MRPRDAAGLWIEIYDPDLPSTGEFARHVINGDQEWVLRAFDMLCIANALCRPWSADDRRAVLCRSTFLSERVVVREARL